MFNLKNVEYVLCIKLNTDCSLLDDNNEDEEFPAPPGSKKNKDTPHTSQLYENNQVKGK